MTDKFGDLFPLDMTPMNTFANPSQYEEPAGPPVPSQPVVSPILDMPPAPARPKLPATPFGDSPWGHIATLAGSMSPQVAPYVNTIAGRQVEQVAADQRQQELDQRKKYQDQQNTVHTIQLLENLNKLPPEYLDYGVKALDTHIQRTGGQPLDPNFLGLLKKTKTEQRQSLIDMAKAAVAGDPNFTNADLSAIANDPRLLVPLLAKSVEREKLQAEQKAAEAKRQTIEKALGGSQDGTSPQPGSSIPTMPNVPPGGSQGALRPVQGLSPVQEQIYREAVKQGVDPAAALAVAEHESSFNFVSGDGGKAAGYFQMHDPAAQDAAKALGMNPEDRHTPEGNIRLGVQYLKQVTDRGGSLAGGLALYNWGTPTYQGKGNPRYIQDVMGGYGRYTKILGGRPQTEAVMGASPEVQQRIAGLGAQIATLQGQADRLMPHTGDKEIDKIYDNITKTIKAKQDEAKRLEDSQAPKATDLAARAAGELGFPKNPAERTQEQDRLINQLVQKWEKERQAAQGENAAAMAPLDDAHLYRDKNNKTAEMATRADLLAENERRKKAGEPLLAKKRQMTVDQEKELQAKNNQITNLQELADKYGTITTGPVAGRMERWKIEFGIDAKDEVVAQRLLLEQIITNEAFTQGGKALTSHELDRFKKTLPKDTDSAPVFRAKLNKALKLAHDFQVDKIKKMRAGGTFVADDWDIPEPTYAEGGETTAPAAASTAAPAPSEKKTKSLDSLGRR